MMQKMVVRVAVLMAVAFAAPLPAFAADKPLAFYVLSQRSIALTAQYWNPILVYVSKKSGVELELKLAKTAAEGNTAAEKGAYQFLFTNHFFTPARDSLGYQVIARPAGPGISAQIVVSEDSPVKSLADLNGKEVAMVTPDGFTGYWLPQDALMRAKVNHKVVFTGNQEASSAQLKFGKVAAAGVNGTVMARYGRRENFAYRTLWTSEIYQDLCIMASSKLPAAQVAAVRDALIGMFADPEGRKVLEAGAALIKSTGDLGFVKAENKDYDNYRAFFKTTQVK